MVRIIVVIALALVAAGGGTAHASQASLPGDALYSLKLGTERAEMMLPGGDVARAERALSFADRRVEEMLALAEKGRSEDLGLPSNHQGNGLVRIDLAVSAASGTEPPPVDQYDLTIFSTAGGSVTDPGEGTFAYDEGTVVELVATPVTDYEFVNWTGDTDPIANVKGASTTITMNGDYSIIANFKSADTPAPEIFIVDPDSASRRDRLMVAISGVNLQDGTAVDFGEGVVIQEVTFVNTGELTVRIRIHNRAATGRRDVTVTNPAEQSHTLTDGFAVS